MLPTLTAWTEDAGTDLLSYVGAELVYYLIVLVKFKEGRSNDPCYT